MEYEWVEILEPETQRKMYANVVTGDCRWEPPQGAAFKPNHENQWWELFDSRSQRSYYYNATTRATVWDRPRDGDVVALAKLQKMQEELARRDAQPAQQQPQLQRQQQPQQPQQPQQHSPVKQQSRESVAAAAAAAPAAPAAQAASGTPPTAPPLPPAKPELAEFKDNLNTHKRGIFRKKVSIATMLSWSKEALKVPMLLTLNKTNKKVALDMFKLVQMYMGDRNSKGRSQVDIALEIVTQCWSTAELRDEIYIQLCKQTTENRDLKSCEAGWELMIISLNIFPPSSKFFNYFEGYIAKHMGNQPGNIALYAEHAAKRLKKIAQTGAKRGNQQPTKEEVEHAKEAIMHPSYFGSTLDEIMEIQAEAHPQETIPWVLKVLAEAVLAQGGQQTEGIFRVPGDIDRVNALKITLDHNEQPHGFDDPHIPGSTLKLWFRELQEPLILEQYYDQCIASCNDANQCLEILNLIEPLNRRIMLYIIRFLQVIGHPDNQPLTKMTFDNLAMVWAPNFLRCPSDDPTVIFQNTKKEMTFVRNLLLHLDAEEAASY